MLEADFLICECGHRIHRWAESCPQCGSPAIYREIKEMVTRPMKQASTEPGPIMDPVERWIAYHPILITALKYCLCVIAAWALILFAFGGRN